MPFETHTIELSAASKVYLFSDGFADQFGGENSKKYKYKPFKELLLNLKNEPPASQCTLLNQHFEEWRGELEQVDDVCVLGFSG